MVGFDLIGTQMTLIERIATYKEKGWWSIIDFYKGWIMMNDGTQMTRIGQILTDEEEG